MTNTSEHNPTQQPSDGGSESNGNVDVQNRPEWKKRPAQYPDAGKQVDVDTGKTD